MIEMWPLLSQRSKDLFWFIRCCTITVSLSENRAFVPVTNTVDCHLCSSVIVQVADMSLILMELNDYRL